MERYQLPTSEETHSRAKKRELVRNQREGRSGQWIANGLRKSAIPFSAINGGWSIVKIAGGSGNRSVVVHGMVRSQPSSRKKKNRVRKDGRNLDKRTNQMVTVTKS